MFKPPFDRGIFFKVFGVVVLGLMITARGVINRIPEEWTITNLVGSSISAVVFSYWVHLWLLPAEDDDPRDD